MLALTSSLVLLVFDEARAVSVSVQAPESVLQSDGTFVVRISVAIPSNQLVPISSVEAILEETPGAARVAVVDIGHASCNSASGCSAPATTGTMGRAIRSILASQANPSPTAGYLTVTKGGSTVVATDLSLQGYGYGYGYGYGGATGGTLNYDITVDAGTLGQGHFWVSFVVHTGSSVVGDIVSEPAHFRVAPAPAASSGNGGTPGAIPPQSLPVSNVPTTVVVLPGGARQASASIPSTLRERPVIDLSSVDARLSTLELAPGVAPAGSTVSVTVSEVLDSSQEPPASGWRLGNLFLEITVTPPQGQPTHVDSSSRSASLAFRLPASAANGAGTVTLLHFKNGEWVAEETTHIFSYNGEPVFVSTIRGFSPFAVVFDEEAPVVTGLTPAPGATVGTRPLFAASISDNREVDGSRTTLQIDGQKVPARITSSGVLYTPTVALTPGEHVAKVTAADIGGLETVREWRFTVVRSSGASAIVSITEPAEGAILTTAPTTFRATLSGTPEPTTLFATIDGQPVTPGVNGNSLLIVLEQPLVDGEHEIVIGATLKNGNGDFDAQTFVVDTLAPTLVLEDASPKGTDGSLLGLLRLVATVADANAVDLTATLDGAAVDATRDGNEWTIVQPTLADGEHVLVLRAVDAAGREATQTLTFTSTAQAAEQTGGQDGETIDRAGVEESSETPGFAALAALAAIGLAALALRRRQ